MPLTYKGLVRGNVVELPVEAHLPDGKEVFIVVPDKGESAEDAAWAALAAETWEEDWVDEDADLVKEE
ncbi:MAG: hypothetical protein FJ279_17675 [Planctomycetes bacterium]|nr:hypothetical protein [Planctomycetota bacterium]MBM4078636.1 hypothetical protein [Planctomycetota bacterium]MBM4084505.1 hypothetical protein [Planctomycetota bacterium]